MRYVVVCLINGEAHNFHERLVQEICTEFNVKRQKLQSHFTIKAPFETDDLDLIKNIENLTESFCRNNKAVPFYIKNYGHFRDNVVFMDIQDNNELTMLSDQYTNELRKISGLEWKSNEMRKKVFHCTVVSKLYPDKFNLIWQYVNENKCEFKCTFDNITLMKWNKDKWIIDKSFRFI